MKYARTHKFLITGVAICISALLVVGSGFLITGNRNALAQPELVPITVENAHAVVEKGVLEGHTDAVNNVVFSPDGLTIASSGGNDSSIRLWDVATQTESIVLDEFDGAVFGITFGDNSNTVISWAVQAKKQLSVWSLETGESDTLPVGDGDALLGEMVFSANHQRLAVDNCLGTVSVNSSAGLLCSFTAIEIGDLNTGETVHTISTDINTRIWGIAFSPDDELIAVTGNRDGSMHLFEVETEEQVALWNSPDMATFGVTISPNGLVAVALGDGAIVLFDIATRSEIARLEGHDHTAVSVVFSPSGDLLASGGVDGTVRLWDVVGRNELAVLQGHSDTVMSLAFSPDGTLLASGGSDGTVRLWAAH